MKLPALLYGGTTAGEWPQLDAKKYASLLKSSGCNCSLIEATAPQYGPDGWRPLDMNAIVSKVITWVKAMQAQKLWTVLHWVNGNDDDRLKVHGLKAHMEALKKLITECGTDYVILCPVAEKNNDRDEAEWERHCLGTWSAAGGHLAYNGTARPSSLPGGYAVLDYHMQRQDDFGPTVAGLVLLDTDNGPIINSLRGSGVPAGSYWDPVKVSNWAKACAARGRSINLYQANSNVMDYAALSALSKAYGAAPAPVDPSPSPKPNRPDWFQKLEAWWKSVWKKIKR